MADFVPILLHIDAHEVVLAESALRGHGIECVVMDRHTFSIEPQLAYGATGARILVPADRLEEAKQVLSGAFALAEDEDAGAAE